MSAMASALMITVAVLAMSCTHRDSERSPGGDVHRPLVVGATASVRTGAGRQISATVISLAWGQGPVVELRVVGAKFTVLPPEPWTLVLETGQELALITSGSMNRLTVSFDGSLPPGSRVRFLHFDPDDSSGDLNFDVEK